MKPEEFDIWLKAQKELGFFDFFLEQIRDKAEKKASSALQEGDTDFIKGEAAALNWVLQQPEKLAESVH